MDYRKKDYYDGQRFSCKIKDDYCEGKIRVIDRIYLCQNEHDGGHLSKDHKFGYNYAWNIRDGSKDNLSDWGVQVTELKLEG